ncbi:MAG: CRP-like cAMP-binding protein [Crocinitomix sp.]|jgi:CRP-like cAMP-binding protein
MNTEFSNFKSYISSLVGMDDSTFELATEFLKIERLSKGEDFISQGSVCNKIAFINSGLLKIYYLKNGIEVNTCFCAENSIASSFESFTNQTASNDSIQALEDSTLIVISKTVLEKLYQMHPKWQELGQKMVEKECFRLSERVQTLGFDSALEKYKTLIENQPQIIQRVPIQDIASYLGVSRETLSRIRSKIVKH